MIKRYASLIRRSVAGIALALSTASLSHGSDIYQGMRWPTPLQLDERVTYSKDEFGKEGITNILMLKYIDGNKIGKWCFVSLPYRHVSFNGESNSGLGNASIGCGPRGSAGNFHWISYGGIVFPSTAEEGNLPLGNSRFDTKLGMFGTYISPDKRFDIDGSFEYSFTGKTDGHNVPNEANIGLVYGRKITDKIRLASGFTEFTRDNGDYMLNSRSVMRYTPSSNFHLELLVDLPLDNKAIPKTKSFTFITRYNL